MVVGFVFAFTMFAGMGMGLQGACCDRDLMGLPLIFFGAMIIVGFGISVIVGLVAGVYPAYKAARMNPLEALRHERWNYFSISWFFKSGA